MKFDLEGLTVYFPYDYIYPEQYNYMLELKRALDAKGHCLLEMPSGTGKTVSLLSLITSYQLAHPERGKLIYCTRTVPEMEKVLEELKRLIAFRENLHEGHPPILAVGLSARKNLCIHPEVGIEYDGSVVDSKCRSLTASWVRDSILGRFPNAMNVTVTSADGSAANTNPATRQQYPDGLCPFFEEFETSGKQLILPQGVYSLADLRQYGKENGWCPYFVARHMIRFAQVVVYNYSYILDPKISSLVSRDLTRDNIVVFDEAHNIDNVCIESLSVNVNRDTLRSGAQSLRTLDTRIREMKAVNNDRLMNEYRRLVDGLAAAGVGRTDELYANPVLPADILQESVPGNIRKAEHFVGFMKRFIEYVKARLDTPHVVSETPQSFTTSAEQNFALPRHTLRFCSDRFVSLLHTLQETNVHEFSSVRVLCDLATLTSTYSDGFVIIIEPVDERLPTIPNPLLQLSCMDASLCMRPVLARFDTVIITSGTLSPPEMYPKMLNFTPKISRSLGMTLTRQCICPLVVSKGNDQTPLSSKFDQRNAEPVIRNYGHLLVELAASVPDGLICFFTSYKYMEDVVSHWHHMGILDDVTRHKLVFIETPNVAETAMSLENYRKACDSGRGAVFLSIARGKVAEGIDFDGHYGRAVVMFGIPYIYTESRILRARLEFLRTKFGIRENDFLAFDALRQASQCIGRVIRNKTDYGLMILADKRYNQWDKRGKLPKWIGEYLRENHLNLSIEVALSISRDFLRQMSQPWQKDEQLGHSLWSQADLERFSSEHHGVPSQPSNAGTSSATQATQAGVSQLPAQPDEVPVTADGPTDVEMDDLARQDLEEALAMENMI
nr:general transcription and DNA repair factor IIH [Seculamonas ecuadoriensis]